MLYKEAIGLSSLNRLISDISVLHISSSISKSFIR